MNKASIPFTAKNIVKKIFNYKVIAMSDTTKWN